MELYIDDKVVSFIYSNKIEEKIVRSNFTYEDMRNVFAGGVFDKRKIKSACLVRKRGKFNFLFSGFLYELLKLVKDSKIKVTLVKDKRTKFEHQKEEYTDEYLKSLLPSFNYVDHQIQSLKAILKTSYGIIEAATGSGKTETFIAIIKLTKLPTLIIVNRVSLALQTYERIKKAGINDVGICYGKGYKDGKVMVSTIGSIKKITALNRFKLLVVDECHHMQSKVYQDFLKSTSFPLRYGFSATPNSGDKHKWAMIKQFLGNVICNIEASKLIEKEVIALPIIKFIKVNCQETMSWPEANYRCIIGNNQKNNLIKKIVEEHKLPTLILIRNIEHGELLNELIKDSVFVSGKDEPETRQKIIKDFSSGVINTVISSNIFNEGISINEIRLLIIASGGKSKIEVIQRLGRCFRIMPDKKEALVFDFFDEGNKYTERHSRQRINIYKKAGFKVS